MTHPGAELAQVWAGPSAPAVAVSLYSTTRFGTVSEADVPPPDQDLFANETFGTQSAAEIEPDCRTSSGTQSLITPQFDLFSFSDTDSVADGHVYTPPAVVYDLYSDSGTSSHIGDVADLVSRFGTTSEATLSAALPYATYANGYRTRVRAVLPGPNPAETIQNAVIRLDTTKLRFRSTDEGGLMSFSGRDVQVVDIASDTVLAHRLVYYDAVTGRLVLDVHLGASTTIGTAHKQLFIYAGAATAPAATDTSPAVFGSFAFVLDPTNGKDLTDRKRDLTLTGTTQFLAPEGPALVFDGIDDHGVSSHQINGFTGLSALSIEARVQSAETSVQANGVEGIICVGPTAGNPVQQHVFSLQRNATPALAGTTNALVGLVTAKTTAGDYDTARWEGANNSGLFPNPTSIVMTWTSGQPIKMYRDGKLLTPAWTGARRGATGTSTAGAVVTGTTDAVVNATAPAKLWVGRGTGGSATGGFRGRIEMLRVRSRGMT